MKTAPFILDRDDFQRAAAALPDDPELARLASAYRTAWVRYLDHRRRETTLATEIAETSRTLGEKADPKLTAKLTALFAEREVWPDVTLELTQAYAEALTAWATATSRAFKQVWDEANSAIDAHGPERRYLVSRAETSGADRDRRAAALADLNRIYAEDRPHRERLDIAAWGIRTVQAEAGRVFDHPPGYATSQRDIDKFVQRQRAKVAA